MSGPLIDTDVLVDHLRGHRRLPDLEDAAYSVLTRAELFSGTHVDEALVDRLLSAFTEMPIDRAIAEEGGRLRRETGIALPDALIAATALLTQRPLYTKNLKDFSRITDLAVYREPG